MDYELIIYAIIAVLVLAKLWSVFGQRNGEDRERPNPFAARPAVRDVRPATPGNPAADTPSAFRPLHVAPASLAGGLAQIKEADPAFDEKQFLKIAREAFAMILCDFAKGDLAESTNLLAPNVLTSFQKAIEARRTDGHVMDHKLVAIREAECVAAKMDGNRAVITVRFVSDQQSTTRDAQGTSVGGSDGKIEEITDIWVFMRDVKSFDPVWMLAETRS